MEDYSNLDLFLGFILWNLSSFGIWCICSGIVDDIKEKRKKKGGENNGK